MPKGPKNGFKKSKNEERHQMHENLKNKLWKPCLRVKYKVGIDFIDFYRDICELQAKNAKPHYANDIKVRFFQK